MGHDSDSESGQVDEPEHEDLSVALRGLGQRMLRNGAHLAALLDAPPDAVDAGPELELLLDFPVTRADTVARGIAAFDARWRLLVGLMMWEQEPEGPIARDVADLVASPEYGLVIVDADMGSLQLRLTPSKKTQAALMTTGAIVGIPAGIAEVTGVNVTGVIDAIRGDGDKCEQIVGHPPLSPAQLDQLGNSIEHMPTGIVIHGKVRLDNGAVVNFRLPQQTRPRDRQHATVHRRR
jgi:hypothetical protein